MKILIVEDELELANVLKDYLQAQDYEVTIIDNGEIADTLILTYPWDLVLLDLMLPGKDGLSICQQVRSQSSVPIIMLTAKVDEVDRLIGLDAGADDYVCKPYSPREVVARVNAVLRRTAQAGALPPSGHFLTLDEDTLSASYRHRTIQLTLVEWRILKTLTIRPGRIFSRNQLIDSAYDDQRVVSDRTVDSHITKLRKKLVVPLACDPIRSVYGVGYKFELPPDLAD